MIDLRINNKSVEFGGLTIVRKNPAFNDIGDYTEPFELANTEINRVATGMIDAEETIPDTEPEAEIRVMGDPYLAGTAIFESTNSGFGGYAIAGKSHFYNLIKGKTLRQLQCNGVRFPIIAPPYTTEQDRTAKTLTLALSYSAMQCDVLSFPFYSKGIILNEWDVENSKFIGLRHAPFLRLTAVLRFIFAEHGYIIHQNAIMYDAELQNLVVFNNVRAASMFFEADGTTPKQWNKHLPDYSIKSFLSDVERVCDVTFYINNATKEVNILRNDSLLAAPSVFNLEPYRTSAITKKRERDKNGRAWSWGDSNNDEYAVAADLTNLVVAGSVATESDLPEATALNADKVYFVRSTNTYWRNKQGGTAEEPTYTAERFAVSGGSLKTGNGSYNRSVGLYPMPMFEYNWPTNYRMLMPRTDQDQLMDIESEKLPFAPSLLFYRGMQNVNADPTWSYATTYPLGSPYKHDVFGNEIQGADREFGTAYMEELNPLMNQWTDSPREYLTCRVDLLPWRIIQQLDFSSVYTFKGLDVVLDEIKIEVDTLGVKTVELGMWRK